MSIHVETSGSGPHLALLHGWGLNGAVWDSVREPLAAHFTLHVVDLPGHGYSSAVPLASLDSAADAIIGVLPERTNLLGWSLGGQVALSIAQRHATLDAETFSDVVHGDDHATLTSDND